MILTVAVLLGASSLGAAGAPVTPDAKSCAAPGKYRDIQAKKYRAYCGLCKLFGVKTIASQRGLPATKPDAVASAYARAIAEPQYREAVSAGCRQGFKLNDAIAKGKKTTPPPQSGNANGNGKGGSQGGGAANAPPGKGDSGKG